VNMADQIANLIILQTNLRNVERTFGKTSEQYLDILEMVETYMTNMESVPETEEIATSIRPASSQPSFGNLAYRPKKQP